MRILNVAQLSSYFSTCEFVTLLKSRVLMLHRVYKNYKTWFDVTDYIVTVERFDPRSNAWTKMPPMGTHRKHLGVAVYNNMIYAVGGRDDSSELSSAEKFNPQTNTWQPVVAMTSRRSGVSTAMSHERFSTPVLSH